MKIFNKINEIVKQNSIFLILNQIIYINYPKHLNIAKK